MLSRKKGSLRCRIVHQGLLLDKGTVARDVFHLFILTRVRTRIFLDFIIMTEKLGRGVDTVELSQ